MLHPLFEALPRASVSLLNMILGPLGPDQPRPLGGNTGLPACALECLVHNLVIAATPVVEPLFDDALVRFAQASGRDVLLIRHGFHPETLDPVRIDVAARTFAGPLLIRDTSLYRALDGSLHLLPECHDLFAEIGEHGLDLSMLPPWRDWEERIEGLERAAAEIVRANARGR